MGKQPAVMASDRLAVFMPDTEHLTLTDDRKLINHSRVARALTIVFNRSQNLNISKSAVAQ